MKFQFHKFSGLAVGAMLLASTQSAWAVNAQLDRPTTGATGGYRVYTSETLPQGSFDFGVAFNFAHDPLEARVFGNGTTPAIAEAFSTLDFLVDYSLTDWLTLGLDMPVNVFQEINPAFGPFRDEASITAGDLMIRAKARVIDASSNSVGFGFAVVPFLTLPSGDYHRFMRDATVTGGFLLAPEIKLGWTRIYANIGPQFRRTDRYANLFIKHTMQYGGGIEQKLCADCMLYAVGEVVGESRFHDLLTSPVEGDLLLRKRWGDEGQFITQAGVGMGFNDAYGSPDWRVIAGLSYVFGGHKAEKPAPTPAPTPAPKAAPAPAPAPRASKIDLKGQINFKTNSAEILPASYPVLDDAVAKMKAHPEIALVRIEGHTDSRGDDNFNLGLSQRRADSVKTYMTQKGIDGNRLTTKGYGETKPIADNKTQAGMAKNRRIEFYVEKWADGR